MSSSGAAPRAAVPASTARAAAAARTAPGRAGPRLAEGKARAAQNRSSTACGREVRAAPRRGCGPFAALEAALFAELAPDGAGRDPGPAPRARPRRLDRSERLELDLWGSGNGTQPGCRADPRRQRHEVIRDALRYRARRWRSSGARSHDPGVSGRGPSMRRGPGRSAGAGPLRCAARPARCPSAPVPSPESPHRRAALRTIREAKPSRPADRALPGRRSRARATQLPSASRPCLGRCRARAHPRKARSQTIPRPGSGAFLAALHFAPGRPYAVVSAARLTCRGRDRRRLGTLARWPKFVLQWPCGADLAPIVLWMPARGRSRQGRHGESRSA